MFPISTLSRLLSATSTQLDCATLTCASPQCEDPRGVPPSVDPRRWQRVYVRCLVHILSQQHLSKRAPTRVSSPICCHVHLLSEFPSFKKGGCFLTTLEGLLTNVYSWPSAPRKTEERSCLSTYMQSWLTTLELRKGLGFRRGRIAQGMPRNWRSAAWSDDERWGEWRCFLHGIYRICLAREEF